MSDPVTNVEVEDVLSSIRRLVSEDKRPTAAPQTPAGQDRLVLTPALRVTDPATDADPVSEDGADETNTAAEFFVAPSTHAEEHQPDAPSPADNLLQDGSEAFVLDADLSAEQLQVDPEHDVAPEEPALNEVKDGSEDDFEHAAFVHVSESDDEAEGNANVETGPWEVVFDHIADTPEDEETAFISEPAAQSDADLEPDAGETYEGDVPVAELMEEDAPLAAATQAATLSAKIAALEAVIGGRDDQWEPDNTGDSDYSGTESAGMDWDDQDPVTAAAAEEPEENTLTDVDDLLDEDMLREMVSDIVRQELQGALGERITRNVRKLVRREIHRAMAAQELE